MNDTVRTFYRKPFKRLGLPGVGTLRDCCLDSHFQRAVFRRIANINKPLVDGAGVIGDRDIAVLGLRFPIERATPDLMDRCRAQPRRGRFRCAPLHAKHEIVTFLKLKGHVLPTASGNSIAAQSPDA